MKHCFSVMLCLLLLGISGVHQATAGDAMALLSDNRLEAAQESPFLLGDSMFDMMWQYKRNKFSIAIARVKPYLKKTIEGVDSSRVIHDRLGEIDTASIQAAALATLDQGSVFSLFRISSEIGAAEGGELFREAVIRGHLDYLAGRDVIYGQWYNVLQALRRQYEFLDIHRAKWSANKTSISFTEQYMSISYQALMHATENDLELLEEILALFPENKFYDSDLLSRRLAQLENIRPKILKKSMPVKCGIRIFDSANERKNLEIRLENRSSEVIGVFKPYVGTIDVMSSGGWNIQDASQAILIAEYVKLKPGDSVKKIIEITPASNKGINSKILLTVYAGSRAGFLTCLNSEGKK